MELKKLLKSLGFSSMQSIIVDCGKGPLCPHYPPKVNLQIFEYLYFFAIFVTLQDFA